jgi:hypothetical protein
MVKGAVNLCQTEMIKPGGEGAAVAGMTVRALCSVGSAVSTDVDALREVVGIKVPRGTVWRIKALEQTELRHDLCSSGQLSVD